VDRGRVPAVTAGQVRRRRQDGESESGRGQQATPFEQFVDEFGFKDLPNGRPQAMPQPSS